MKPLRSLLILVVILLVTSALAEDVKPTSELGTVIPQGIKLLEAKEFKTFMQLFIPPGEFNKVEKEGGLDEFAKKWGSSDRAARLLEVLKAVKDTKPEMSEDGKKATYGLNDPVKKTSSVSFIKIEEGWYLKD